MLDEIFEAMENCNEFEDKMAEIFLENCEYYNDYKEIVNAMYEGYLTLFDGSIKDSNQELFRNYFNEILDIINYEYEERYGKKYDDELDCDTLVCTALEVLMDRWYDGILTLVEDGEYELQRKNQFNSNASYDFSFYLIDKDEEVCSKHGVTEDMIMRAILKYITKNHIRTEDYFNIDYNEKLELDFEITDIIGGYYAISVEYIYEK